MNKAIDLSELSPEVRAQIAGELELIPEKWEVYAKVLLLIMSLHSLPTAKWVINRLRRELDKMGQKKTKENS